MLVDWERYACFDERETSPSPPIDNSIETSVSMAPNTNLEDSFSSSMSQDLEVEDSSNLALVESFDVHI